MISTGSIFFTAILVFGLMLIGIVLTSLEFKKISEVSEDERQLQKESANRHRARVVSPESDDISQPEGDQLSEADALRH
jgi:uncharacterized membrane protein